jgi:hypothetical protein
MGGFLMTSDIRALNVHESIGPVLSVKWIKETAKKFNVSVIVSLDAKRVLYIFEIIGEKENRRKMIEFLKRMKPLGIPFEFKEKNQDEHA